MKTEDKKDVEVIRRKVMIVEKFINFMIIVKIYFTSVPLWIWATFLVLVYALKLRR